MSQRNATGQSGDNKLLRRIAELEARLAKAEEERLAWLRSLSAAGHDMRQPYQAMRLFHHLVMMNLSDAEAVEVGTRLGEAIDAAERQLNGLLDYAKVESGRVRPQLAETVLHDLIAPIVQEIKPHAAAKGLTLRVRVPRTLSVRTDPTLLSRIVRSLTENAVHHTARGRILLGARRLQAATRLEIWDTGPGIADEHLDAIFEPFVRLPSIEPDAHGGLGLGLPAVRRMGDLLGCTVTVRSWPGKGSVFAVTIPAAPALHRGRRAGGGER